MTYVPNSGSVVAFQSDPSKLQASVTGVVAISNTPSVFADISGSVLAYQPTPANFQASVTGTVAITSSVQVIGSVQVLNAVALTPSDGLTNTTFTARLLDAGGTARTALGSAPYVFNGVNWDRLRGNSSVGALVSTANQSVITVIQGSVAVAVTPAANQSVSGTVGASIIGLVPVFIASGSVAATFTPPANQSVSGTVDASIVGVGIDNQADGATSQNQLMVDGRIRVYNGSNWDRLRGNSSIGALVSTGASSVLTVPTGTQNVSGSVVAFQGTSPWIITGSVQGGTANQSVSGTVGASVIGTVPVTQSGTWNVSIAGIPSISGTVQVGNFPTNQNVSGSVVAFQGGIGITSISGTVVIASIVGTYSEDIQSTAADKGLFTLGIRNDTVASLVGTDLDYTGWSTDSAGRHLVKPFAAIEASVIGHGSVNGVASVQLFPAAGAGLKNYVTDFFISNTGTTTTLVTFTDDDASILGRTIAPAGGGSNGNGLNTPLVNIRANTKVNMTAATATSVLYGWAAGFKAP